MPTNILLIEDDNDINALVALNLEVLKYNVTRCNDGKLGFDLACQHQYNLIILDLMLPGMEGLQVCQHLRARGNNTPILMVTAKKSEADRVVGLEIGADDYLTKPFGVRELQARVKALLRRAELHATSVPQDDNQDKILQFNALSIDESKRRVLLSEQEIHLTAKEFDLLLFLARRPGQVFSREQLLDSIWGYHHSGYEHTVNSHINRLRNKLEKNSSEPEYVLTVWGVGYKFQSPA